MKTTIYYFTGTGNSLAITKKISEGLVNTEILSISDLINLEKLEELDTNSDNIGFIFPVYLHLPPKQVIEFIKRIKIKNNPYIFSIITNNGEPGRCGYVIDQELKIKGSRLNYSDTVLMPGNSIVVQGYINTDEERSKRFTDSYAETQRIIANIKNRTNMLKNYKTPVMASVKSMFMAFVFNNILKPHKKYYTTNDCTGCGVCTKVCPAHNVTIKNGIVEWGNNCEFCFACIHLCPKEASQINKNTINGLRYKHPDIIIKELYRRAI